MRREPIYVTFEVPFHEVDESFDWWMRQYDRDPDGQYLAAARQLKPHVTTEMYEVHRKQFEHPKGETVVVVIGRSNYSRERLAPMCIQHNRPIEAGYCDTEIRADRRPV